MLIERLEIGGIETVIWELLHAIDRARFRVLPWFLAGQGPSFERMQTVFPETRFVPVPTYHRPGPVWRLARALRHAGAELVHAQGYFAGGVGRLVAPWLRLPWVYALHSQYVDTYRWRNYLMERYLARSPGMVVACSESVRSFAVERCGIPAAKTTVIYNGVDLPPAASWPTPAAARLTYGIPADVFVIGTVARLSPGKNVQLLLRAAEALPASCHALIVGDGPERPALEALAKTPALQGRVHFAGESREVMPAYRAMDLYVQPSRVREGFSLALAEAMGFGVPVIATAVGGMVEVVGEDAGWLVPPDDVQALNQTLQRAMDDPPLRARAAHAARARYLQWFTASRMARATEAVYDRLLGASRA